MKITKDKICAICKENDQSKFDKFDENRKYNICSWCNMITMANRLIK